MKTVYNPESKPLHIQFKGTKYGVEADSTTTVRDDVAAFWKGIHHFITIADASDEVTSTGTDSVVEEAPVIDISMSRTELDEIAKVRGIDTVSLKNKEEVVAAIIGLSEESDGHPVPVLAGEEEEEEDK